MAERDDIIERVSETLKEPVGIDPALDRRVMAEIEALPASERHPVPVSILDWFKEPRVVRLSPLTGLTAAAAIAVVGIGLGRFSLDAPSTSDAVPAVAASMPPGSTMEFVLVAPAAASVSVVGDFNDWDLEATPLNRAEGDGVWSVIVPLAPGRYRYSFVVDGTVWRSDPGGTPAVEDEFGRPNSVLTIGGIS